MRKGNLLDKQGKEQKQSFGEPAGNQVDMTIVKTKVSKPDRKIGYYTLNYTNGIDEIADTVEVAILHDIIKIAGSYFYIMDEEGEILVDVDGNKFSFQGKTKLLEYLNEDEDMYLEIKDRVHKAII